MMKQNSLKVFEYVKKHEDENIIANDIADGIWPGEEAVRRVNGIITAAFQRHKNADGDVEPLMERVDGEIELPTGQHKAVKFIKLTEAGRAFDPADEVEK